MEKDSEYKPRRPLVGEYATCADPHYVTRAVTLDQPVDRGMLVEALQAIQPNVYRIKGFVPTPDGTMYVDVSAGGVTCQPAANANIRHDLVFIAEPLSLPGIEDLIRRLQTASGLRTL